MDTAERSNLRTEGSLLCLKTGFLGLNCFNQKKSPLLLLAKEFKTEGIHTSADTESRGHLTYVNI